VVAEALSTPNDSDDGRRPVDAEGQVQRSVETALEHADRP